MKPTNNYTSELAPPSRVYLVMLSVVAIFVLDMLVPLGVAMGALYIVPIVAMASVGNRRLVLTAAWIATAFTLVAFFAFLSSQVSWFVWANRGISLLAIWATTWSILLYISGVERRRQAELDHQQRIERKNTSLRSKNRELEQFAYIASHDLQEPLRSITSFTGLLERDLNREFEGNLPGQLGHYVNFLQESAARIRELIHALLEYSRVGRSLNRQRVLTRQVVDDAIGDLSAAIEQSGASIKVGPLPIHIFADPTELRLLFLNLIGNGIKFSRPDVPPIVSVSGQQSDQGWTFCIGDNGIGMEAEHISKIFIIFQRLNNRQDYSGSGIGLANCQKIVELHGGRIWVESTPGVGSFFHFTINESQDDQTENDIVD